MDEKTSTQGVECMEPLISQIGGSVTLKVPVTAKKEQPNWKRQNPRAYLITEKDTVKLVYEWKAKNNQIISEE